MKWPLGRIIQVHTGCSKVSRCENCVRSIKASDTSTCFFFLPIIQDPEITIAAEDNNKNSNNATGYPKTKRIKVQTHQLALALVTILLLFPLAVGTSVKNNKFVLRVEQIGLVAILITEWNMLVYCDLASYWSVISILIKRSRSIQTLFNMLTTNTSCHGTTEHFEQIKKGPKTRKQIISS